MPTIPETRSGCKPTTNGYHTTNGHTRNGLLLSTNGKSRKGHCPAFPAAPFFDLDDEAQDVVLAKAAEQALEDVKTPAPDSTDEALKMVCRFVSHLFAETELP